MMLNMPNRLNKIVALTTYLYRKRSPNGIDFKSSKGIFSFGIIWSALKMLIIIGGISTIFGIGLRGTGIHIEAFSFNLLFYFCFAEAARTLATLAINPAIREDKNISFNIFFISNYLRVITQFFIMGIIICIVLYFFGYKLNITYTMIAFCLNAIFIFVYCVIVAGLINKKAFLIELHDFVIQGMFFISSVIIPVSILPNFVIDILVWNPLVHINEFVKEPYTNIYLSYIDIYYPLKFILAFSVLLIPLLFYFEKQYADGRR